jgi:hypothetical protein
MTKRTGSLGRGQDRGQARGRERTKVIRSGLFDLELPPDWGPPPGVRPDDQDLGWDDEADGDQVLDDAEAPGSEAVALGPHDPEPPEGVEARAAGMTLRTLLGSRSPAVLVRLVQDGADIRARVCAAPATVNAAEALEELRLFVENLFREGRGRLADAEWARLVGAEPAPLFERLLLLSRLAVSGSAEVVVEGYLREDASDRPGGPGRYKFTPNDRGLERYANKFAALPDGTPFGIRLLLLDGRGRPDPHPFKQLPAAVKLEALRRALEAEARGGRAGEDEAFRDRLQEALRSLGLVLDKPTYRHVLNLRVTLQRNGLGHLFPNAQERQRAYDRAPGHSEVTA